MDKPIVHAMTAAFLSLGMAAGGDVLQRAGDHIRDFLADNSASHETTEILEGVMAGIDCDAPNYCWLDDAMFTAGAHADA